MFFRHFFLLALIGLASLLLGEEDLNDQKRQVYMLKGQLYAQEQKLELEKLVKQKNGFFIGALLGNVTINLDTKDNASHPLIYGLRAGYQKYLGNYVTGLRFYAEYLRGDEISHQGDETSHRAYQIGSVNLDLLLDVPLDEDKKFSLGLFGGVGMGWLGYEYKNTDLKLININQLGMVINLGVALSLNIKHRIEAGLKIPPIKVKGSPSDGLDSSNLYFVSYNFLF